MSLERNQNLLNGMSKLQNFKRQKVQNKNVLNDLLMTAIKKPMHNLREDTLYEIQYYKLNRQPF